MRRGILYVTGQSLLVDTLCARLAVRRTALRGNLAAAALEVESMSRRRTESHKCFERLQEAFGLAGMFFNLSIHGGMRHIDGLDLLMENHAGKSDNDQNEDNNGQIWRLQTEFIFAEADVKVIWTWL